MVDITPSSQQSVPRHLQAENAEVFAEAIAVLVRGVKEHAFPGAAFAVTQEDRTILRGSIGRFTYEPDSPEVLHETVFDLASVTKVVATTSMAMKLYDAGRLNLEQRVAELVPEFVAGDQARDPRRNEITVRMLLAHSSGLPAYRRLFEQAGTREELLGAIYSMPLEAAPGARAEYSDIGFILLGEALQRIIGESLDGFCQREIFATLGMTHTAYLPPAEWRSGIPPTVNDTTFRHRTIQGEVNDENASVLGGVSAHAGIFSNAEDASRFALSMLGYGRQLFRPGTVALFTARQTTPAGSSRALGWDTPSAPSQAGRYFSSHSFGHLGYTGTSLWIDGRRKISITLLTNRTWPDARSQAIKQMRPQFHDAVMKQLIEGEN